MWRNENQKPNTGCLSVPLFNQRKRSRLPFTSNPSEIFGQSSQWNQQANLSSQQAGGKYASSPGMAGRGYTPLPHPRKPAYAWPQIGQQRPPVRQDSMANQIHGAFPSSNSASYGQPSWSSGIQNQQSFNRPTNSFRMPYRPQPCSSVAGNSQGPLNHSGTWNFRPIGQSTSGMWPKEKMDTSVVQTTPKQQKPSRETSMRVITAVIEGMKHWSQYKNRVPMLFEIFATLDSAVTIGEHGAKKFLMRDDKHVVQCLYYENDQTLPRLIRGQVHRCVGNYDKDKDIMKCVSVRAASLSEQKNAQEAVRASDAELRNVLLTLSEI